MLIQIELRNGNPSVENLAVKVFLGNKQVRVSDHSRHKGVGWVEVAHELRDMLYISKNQLFRYALNKYQTV